MTLRIGVDAHALGRRQTGNERFVAGVLGALSDRDDVEAVAFVDGSAQIRLPNGVERVELRSKGGAARLGWELPRRVRSSGIDVFLAQYLVPRRLGVPAVAVVHDVSFEVHPEWFSPTERRWMRKLIPASIRRADGIVTVSEFSK